MKLKLLATMLGVVALLAAGSAAAQNIKIAILGPMAFVQGENHWAGAEMARDEINKAGGISVGGTKRQVEIIKIDTNEILSVPDATNAIERAISRDKADFLIGGFRSEAVLAMQEVAMDSKKLFMGVGAAHSKLGLNVEQNYERYKYWFRASPTIINPPEKKVENNTTIINPPKVEKKVENNTTIINPPPPGPPK